MSPTTRSHQTVFSLGCLALLLSACSRGPDAATSAAGPGERRGPLPYVEVVQTRSGTLPLEQRLSGIVRARNEVVIFPEMTGRIDEVMVDNGDAVTRGQPLVRIHARQVEEQLRQARANLRMQEAAADQARAQLQELRAQLALSDTLARRDFITERELIRLQAEVEVAEAGYARAQAVVESAEAAVEEREWLLTQTVIRSPIDGVVGRRRAEIGMRVDGSSNLFVVGDLSQVRVSVQLTEQLARQVEVGQPALIRHPQLPHEALEARISRISPFLEAGSFSTEASIDLANPDGLLRSGMYVDVDVFFGESETATLVPISALHEIPRRRAFGVFVVAADPSQDHLSDGSESSIDDRSSVRFQEVGIIARGRRTAGVTGLPPGAWVVATGHDLLSTSPADEETQAVRVRPIDWDRLIALQGLQSQDVLSQFLQRQRGNASAAAN